MDEGRIRKAVLADACRLAELAGELGYPATGAEMAGRLERVLADPDHVVLAAEVEGAVAGWVHAYVQGLLLVDGRAEVGGLVVGAPYRRRGIGRALMAAAERWAGSRGCRALRARSAGHRREAHLFYAGTGFEPVKEQRVFDKPLPDGGG